MASGLTILILDEEVSFASTICESLRSLGYNALIASDAHSGLELAGRIDPDLVVTEMLLPGRSGFSVAEELKLRDRRRPIIMVATYGAMAQRRLAEFIGVDEFLAKPVSANRVLECVRRLCPLGLNPPHARSQPQRVSDAVPGN